MKNVILLCDELKEGGSEEIILSLARHLDRRKYITRVVYRSAGPILHTFRQYHIPCIQLEGRSPREQIEHLRQLIRRYRVDHVLCNYLHWGHLVTRSNGANSIEVAHGEYFWLTDNAEYHAALQQSDRVISVSQGVVDYMTQHFPEVASKLDLIENGIDPTKLIPTTSASEIRRRLQIPEDGLVMGSMGRICPEKGVSRMLEVARILQKKYDQLYFVIPGDPHRREGYYAELQEQIRRYKLQRVIFPGFVHNVADYYQIYDIFLFPSYLQEGLQLALVEALKMGLPLVTTDMGVVSYDPDMADGQVGFVVPNDQYSDQIFSERVARLIDDPELRRQIGQRNQRVFAEKYNVTGMVKKYEAILAELELEREREERRSSHTRSPFRKYQGVEKRWRD